MKSSNPLGKYNWLIPSKDKEKFYHISLPLDKSLPTSHKKTVLTCRYEWLLISQEHAAESYRSYQFSLWKPESSKLIQLPPLNLKPNQIIQAGTLLSSPDNPGCTVLLFEQVCRYFIFFKFGDKQWMERWFDKEMRDIGDESFISKKFIAHCDGKLYVATLSSNSLMLIKETRPKLRPLDFGLLSEEVFA